MLSVERAPQALTFSSRNIKAGPGAVDAAFAEASPLFRDSLEGWPQSDMTSWHGASQQQASPAPEGLGQAAPETPAFAAPAGDMTGSFPESYDPLALPGWNLGEDETWTSLLGELDGPALGGDPLGSGYMDLGPETPSPHLAAPPAGGPWEASPLPPFQSGVSEGFHQRTTDVKTVVPGSSAKGGAAAGGVAVEGQGVRKTGLALADHVRELILKGSGYAPASRGEKAPPQERVAFPTSLSRSSQGSGGSQVAEPAVLGGTLGPSLKEPRKDIEGEKSEAAKAEAEWSISELRGMLGLDAGEGEGEGEDALAPVPETPLPADLLRSEQQPLGGALAASRSCSGSGSGLGFGSRRNSGSPRGSSPSGSLRSGGVQELGERRRAPLSREGSGSLAADSSRSGSHHSLHSGRSRGSGDGSVRGMPSPRSGEGHLAGSKRGINESAAAGELDLDMDLDGPSGSDSMVGGHGSTDASGSLSCDGCSSGQTLSPSSLDHSSGAGEEEEGVEDLPPLVEEAGAHTAELPHGDAPAGRSQWHNKAAMLLLHRTNTPCQGSPGSSSEGCRCGRCPAEAAAFGAGSSGEEGGAQQPPLVRSSRRPQGGSKEQARDGRTTVSKPQVLAAQAVNERSRPGDLSGRLAAVLGQLSCTPGLIEEPYAPGMGPNTGGKQGEEAAQGEGQKQELESFVLPGGDSFMQVMSVQPDVGTGGVATKGSGRSTSSSSPPSGASRRAQAAGASSPVAAGRKGQAAAAATPASVAVTAAAAEKKAAGGAARGLKRDARRKKGKFSVDSPAVGSAGSLAVAAGGGALVVASQRGHAGSAAYLRACDVDASWHLTPGALPSPSLPALTAFGEPQGGPSFSPRDFVFPPSPSPAPFTFGASLDLGAQAHSAGTPRGGRASNVTGPGLLPGLGGQDASEGGWGGVEAKRPLRDQLMQLAEAYAVDDTVKVRSLTRKLEKKADRMGGPDQRLALYFLQALEARAEGTASAKYMAPITIPAVELNAAMQALCRRIPFLQTSQLVTHEAILAATAGSDSIHILALGMWHGDNWGELFARMAQRPGGPPAKVRISGVDAPCTPGKLAIKVSTANAVLQVKAAAAQAGIQAQVEFLETPIDKLRAGSVAVHPGETLVVFCSMRLQHLPDGSVVRANPRDSLLQAIFDLKPKCFVLTEIDSNFNSPFFLARVKEALMYFGTVFESVDAMSERACPKRQIFEEAYFGRDILNVVACEGLQRMSRTERIEQWADRLRRLGFSPAPFPPSVVDKLRTLYACRAQEALALSREGATSRAPGSPLVNEERQFRVVEVPDGLEVGWGRGRLLFGSNWTAAGPTISTTTTHMEA